MKYHIEKTEIRNGKEEFSGMLFNFSGKTIAPFCTSGGSGVGRSDLELHKNVGGNVKWCKGVQINRPNETEITNWLKNIL